MVLAPVGLPGDLNRIVRQFRLQIQPPLQHPALMLPASAPVGAGQQLQLGVDPAFQAVGGGFALPRAGGLADKAPWLLESRLVALGAEYEKAPEPWASYVTVDGNLYTGQNPTSSRELAQRLVKDLA